MPHLELTSAPAAPADLLRLRPDVASAEAQTLLAAASTGRGARRSCCRASISQAFDQLSTDAVIGNPADAGLTLVSGLALNLDAVVRLGAVALRCQRQRDAQFDQSLISLSAKP